MKTYLKGAVGIFLLSTLAAAADSDAVNGCIDKLREVGGPDGAAGEVIDSLFSEAATEVTLRDRGGSVWKCLAYSDGTVEELRLVDAMDDGGGAMAEPETTRQAVRFAKGTSGAELTGSLSPGSSAQYTLGAKDGQFLYVRVASGGNMLDFQILNPDGSFLLDMIGSDKEYRGQLWQNGEHVVEVINRSGSTQSYNVIFGIE